MQNYIQSVFVFIKCLMNLTFVQSKVRKTLRLIPVFQFFAITVLCLVNAQEVIGKDYYVSTIGNDSSSGTISAPWKTIQKAANVMIAGDFCKVTSGQYNERIIIKISGSLNAPITFFADGNVIMQGFSITASYITINGFEITDTPNDNTKGFGIWISTGSYCNIINNYIHYATRGGITCEAATSTCTIKNNRLYRNAMHGIDLSGTNHLVEGNEVWGTIQHHPKWTNPPSYVDADGIKFFGTGHTIRKNYIHDINYGVPENVDPHIDCFQTFSDSYHPAANNVIIEQNKCVNMTAQGPNEQGHAVMLKSASYITIRNNIFQTFSGVETGGGGNSYLRIFNNTFSGSLSSNLSFYPVGINLVDAPNCIIKNNVFYDRPSHIIYLVGTSSQGLDVGYDLIYRSDGQKPWGSPYPNDLWNVDPKFVNAAQNDFRLSTGSPCIDAGTALSDVSNDFDGNPRTQGSKYDIGAYELLKQPSPPEGLKVK